MHIEVETERLILRRFTTADADNLVELDSDPEVMHFLTGGTSTTREVIEHEILPRILREYAAGGGRSAAIEKSSGAFLGWFALDPAKTARELELGYRLRRSSWGSGYATEGALALIDLAFGELEAQRVFAETMFVNAASRRVLEKAGLKHVRTFHPVWDDPIAGAEYGEVEYALSRADWQRR